MLQCFQCITCCHRCAIHLQQLHRQYTVTDFNVYIWELNKLHMQRTELQNSLKKRFMLVCIFLRLFCNSVRCMCSLFNSCICILNLLEKKRAWQDDQHLSILVQQHQAIMQVGICPAVNQMDAWRIVSLVMRDTLCNVYTVCP